MRIQPTNLRVETSSTSQKSTSRVCERVEAGVFFLRPTAPRAVQRSGAGASRGGELRAGSGEGAGAARSTGLGGAAAGAGAAGVRARGRRRGDGVGWLVCSPNGQLVGTSKHGNNTATKGQVQVEMGRRDELEAWRA